MPKLTKRYIDAVRYEGDGRSRDVRWDDAMPGFGLRVYPSGRKSFVLSYRTGAARKRMIVLGAYGLDLTLDQARDKATKERAKLVDGGDPLAERKRARAAADAGDTFKSVSESFVERYVKPNLRPRPAAESERIINRELVPTWGKRKVSDISRRDVIELLDAITDRGSPIMANRTLAVVRRLFNWCVERGVIDASPVTGVKAPGKETKRDRVLDDNELRLVWNAADGLGWPFGPFVQLLVLTGQRRGEVASMKWADLDLEGNGPKWTLPREVTKGDRAHDVPLSPQVVTIIVDLPRMDSVFVFDTGRRKEDTPIGNFTRPKLNLNAKIAGLVTEEGAKPPPPWTFHDLRRSAASGMAALNIPPHILSRVLNHAAGAAEGITAIYNRHTYAEEQRHALNAWGAHVERIVAGKDAANIVELRRASD